MVPQVDLVTHYADIIQIGARNMYYQELLAKVGKKGKPFCSKRFRRLDYY